MFKPPEMCALIYSPSKNYQGKKTEKKKETRETLIYCDLKFNKEVNNYEIRRRICF